MCYLNVSVFHVSLLLFKFFLNHDIHEACDLTLLKLPLELSNPERLADLTFLVDLTVHLSMLNKRWACVTNVCAH